MMKHFVLALPILLTFVGLSQAAERYFFNDGKKAFFCDRPAKYSAGCYIIRNNPKVIRVDGFPVISNSRATTIIKNCGTSIVTSSPPVDPIAACCGCTSTSDCKCKKHLFCELKLYPSNCRKSGKTIKTPIDYQVFGKIPTEEDTEDCYEKIRDFEYQTKVPTIMCLTQKCVEIGTKKIECKVEECKPGCSFKVCVPINDCLTKTVECKLIDQVMPHTVFKRTDAIDSFDVYVNNDPNPSAPFHAGGMPREWLVMHCASREEVRKRFPGMIANNQRKDATPQSTDADVNIELAFDAELLKSYLEESDGEGRDDENVTSPEESGLSIDSEDSQPESSPMKGSASKVVAQVG